MKKLASMVLLAGILSPALQAAPLDLDSYLGQVRQGNSSLRGDEAQDAAYALAAKQPLTAYSPQLAGQVSHSDNQEMPLGATALNPANTEALNWDTNLSKLFSTGTQLSLDYSGDRSRFGFGQTAAGLMSNPQDAAFSAFLPPTGFTYGQQASINVSQPLWRNFMAAQVEAGVSKAQADADAARAANRYQAQATLFQARQAYAQLVTLRQVAAILKESLDRNKKILDWTRAKFDDNLVDKVDVLQSEAALRQVAFNLAQNKEDEAKAAAVFNALRGLSPTGEAEDLEPLKAPEVLPAAKDTRRDVEAAEAALRASDALVRSVVQQFTPDISVFATLGEAERTPPVGYGLDGYRPDTVVGLKFSANLDVVLYRQVLAGAEKARGSGEAALADKRRTLEQDWTELKQGFDGVKERLALARELETLQKEKADREKVRYQDGRTTNFQVLRFEDDYNLSRVQTLQLTAQATVLEAQARFYNGDDQPW